MRRLFRQIKLFFKKGDILLLVLCLIASVFGLVVIASATNYIGSMRYIFVQAAAICLGTLCYFVFTLLDIEILAERRQLLTVFNVLFLGMLLVWGVEQGGNRSWLRFSFLSFDIQPAELCKFTFIIVVAKTMSVYQNKVSSLKCVTHISAQLFLVVGLIIVISKDAGVALTFVFIFCVIAYTGGVKLWLILCGLGAVAAAAPFIWTNLMSSYQKERILMLFDDSIDPLGIGVRYQTKLSLRYFSGGGLTGQGLFNGNMTQSGSIREQRNDFIFSVVGEELGMLGCVLLLFLLLAIVLRCIYIGLRSPNYMNRLICIGIAAMLISQIGVNIGMCLGVFPVVGLTLPFISYGGSSIVTMFIAMGIVSGIKMRPAPDTSAHYIRPY